MLKKLLQETFFSIYVENLSSLYARKSIFSKILQKDLFNFFLRKCFCAEV